MSECLGRLKVSVTAYYYCIWTNSQDPKGVFQGPVTSLSCKNWIEDRSKSMIAKKHLNYKRYIS